MCGRYSIFRPPDELEARFDVAVDDEYRVHYNAAPSQSPPVVTTEANEFQSDYHHRMPVVLAPDEERK